MSISLKAILKFTKKLWFIFVGEFVLLSGLISLFLFFTTNITAKYSSTLSINADSNNSYVDYIYNNTKELIQTDAFKSDLVAYIENEAGNRIDSIEVELDRRQTSPFVNIIYTSNNYDTSRAVSTGCAKFLIYIASPEGKAKYQYSSYMVDYIFGSEILNESQEVTKNRTIYTYIGGVALAFGVSLFSYCVSLALNKNVIVDTTRKE